MGLHRWNMVLWSQSATSIGRPDRPRLTRAGRIRRRIRLGFLLAVVALLPVARAVQPRWRPLLAGTVLTVAGFLLRSGPGSIALLPGLMLLITAPLLPGVPAGDRGRQGELKRELATYSTPAQRRDLEAMLDRYPDRVTTELRTILAGQEPRHW
ncbi:MAG: hypothetical protein WAK82_09460 [Streptosporangiaceae bacterium]